MTSFWKKIIGLWCHGDVDYVKEVANHFDVFILVDVFSYDESADLILIKMDLPITVETSK